MNLKSYGTDILKYYIDSYFCMVCNYFNDSYTLIDDTVHTGNDNILK